MSGRRAGMPLRHPGPRSEQRLVSVPTPVSVVHAELSPGVVVSDALREFAESAGCRAASVELGHGSFGVLRYVHPAVGTDDRPAYFSETIEPPGPCFLLGGSATVGRRDGRGFTHLHATWLDGNGRLGGGHLLPETTVGAVPIRTTVRLLHDVELVSDTDPETRMPVFTPHAASAPAPVSASWQGRKRTRAVMSRVRPGVDLHAAVAEVAGQAGFDRAVVRASLGSVVGARLRTGPGRIAEADWPASEVTMLAGMVTGRDDPEVVLSVSTVDRNGEVHSGVPLEGQNPVAVTFELYVEEGDPDAAR